MIAGERAAATVEGRGGLKAAGGGLGSDDGQIQNSIAPPCPQLRFRKASR
jgi:hypothetical protein